MSMHMLMFVHAYTHACVFFLNLRYADGARFKDKACWLRLINVACLNVIPYILLIKGEIACEFTTIEHWYLDVMKNK